MNRNLSGAFKKRCYLHSEKFKNLSVTPVTVFFTDNFKKDFTY